MSNSFAVIAGKNGGEPKNMFIAVVDTYEEVKPTLERFLAANNDWAEVRGPGAIESFVAGYPACNDCKGAGHHTRWLNSVTPDKRLQPMAHKFNCATCEGSGRNPNAPRQWLW